MATVNPDDAEFTCKNPDCPKGVFQQKTILGHIMKARNCKVFYSEEEISSIRETSIAIQKKNKAQKRKRETITSKFEETSKDMEKTKTNCQICNKLFVSLLTHLNRAEDCKAKYDKEYEELKMKRELEIKEYQKNYKIKKKSEITEQMKEYRSKHKDMLSQKKSQVYEDNKDEINKRNKQYYENKKDEINRKKRFKYLIHKKEMNEKRKRKNPQERMRAFKRDIIHGPNYACFSCKRILFKNSVKILEMKDIASLLSKLNENFLKKVDLHNFQEIRLIFCHNCFKLIKNSKVPKIHVSNGLKLDKVPEELKLSDLEQQLIARSLLFMKVKKLPTTRMKAMIDKVISVPIEENDVSKTISELEFSLLKYILCMMLIPHQ